MRASVDQQCHQSSVCGSRMPRVCYHTLSSSALYLGEKTLHAQRCHDAMIMTSDSLQKDCICLKDFQTSHPEWSRHIDSKGSCRESLKELWVPAEKQCGRWRSCLGNTLWRGWGAQQIHPATALPWSLSRPGGAAHLRGALHLQSALWHGNFKLPLICSCLGLPSARPALTSMNLHELKRHAINDMA